MVALNLIVWVWGLSLSILAAGNQTVHIIGDSHASFCFRESKQLCVTESFVLSVATKVFCGELPIKIHWVGPTTMHRVGRDGLQYLNVKNFNVQDGDIVVFVFGEIDVRCHIGKQRDVKKRKLDDIIDSLARNYVRTILENKKCFNHLECVVCCVIPPLDGIERNNPEYPFYGQLSDRVTITHCLNEKLRNLCALHNILFLDFYSRYATAAGSLDSAFADATVHIDSRYNAPIKKDLINLIVPLLCFN